MSKLKIPLSIIFSVITFLIYSQEPYQTGELGKGLKDFQNLDYSGAIKHIENFLNESQDMDEDSYEFACFIAGTSARILGDCVKSKKYLDEISISQEMPLEIRSAIITSQLQNCMNLSLSEECIPFVNELEELNRKFPSLNLIHKLVSYYQSINDYTNILKFESQINNYEVSNKVTTISDITELSSIHGVYMVFAWVYREKENWDKALGYFFKCLDTYYEGNGNDISDLYTHIANAYSHLGDRRNALKYQDMVFNTKKSESPIKNKDLEKILKKLEKTTNIGKKENDKRFESIKLMEHGILLSMNGQYKESIKNLEEAYKIFQELEEYDYQIYVLNWLVNDFNGMGNKEKYLSAKEKLKDALTENKIEDNIIRLMILSAYGEILKKEGQVDESLKIIIKTLDMALDIYGPLNIELFSYYYRLASLYLDLGKLNEAKSIIEEAKSLDLANQLDKNDYYSLIILESYLLQETGQIGEMLSLLEGITDEIENYESSEKNKSSLYEALGSAYSTLGDFDKARIYKERTLELEKKIYGKNSPYYATALLNSSQDFSMAGNKKKAIEMCIQATKIFESLYGKNNENYIHGLMRLAGLYSHNNPDYARKIYHECSQLWKSLYGENSKEYAKNLIWANLDLNLQPSEESLLEVKKGMEILKSIGYDEELFYLSFLNFYADMLYFSQQWNDLLPVLHELLNKTKSYVYNNFLVMPANQREILWNTVKHKLNGIEQMSSEYSHYAVENQDLSLIDEYSSLCYDSRLLKKGILLTSSKNIEELINKIDEPRINELRIQISNLINLQLQKDPLDVEFERLNREINLLERELLAIITESGDFMDFLKINWQGIQNALWPGEVAIEFFAIPNPLRNFTQYGAIILNDCEKPICISTFCDFELADFYDEEEGNYDYSNPSLYKKIWSVIEVFSIVKNAHTIYFSADGILNTINIENLIDENGKYASDKRNLVRLSSTRELLKRNKLTSEKDFKNLKYHTIVLYGGLDYDAPLDSNDSTYTESKDPEIFRNSAHRSFITKAESLPGTLKEVNLLSEKFKNANVIQYTGSKGTEESVTFIPNKHPYLLHIATHGFYYDANTEDKGKRISNQPNLILNIQDNSLSPETKAMKASGLLFSGANHTLKGEKSIKQNNDGILTAEELSDLKLDEVDLVVLSACETGLGSVSEEGVFGLQRGFKLTGVNSILMTLWKVDDDATQILMQYFYENLINGESKIRSLKLAQEKLRATPGYEDPEYWAAFILLDALN